MRVAIAGGGIAGMTTAMALERAGIEAGEPRETFPYAV
jgi:uncharacterized protein with NAD-binding domain and iron-sulfur cluster